MTNAGLPAESPPAGRIWMASSSGVPRPQPTPLRETVFSRRAGISDRVRDQKFPARTSPRHSRSAGDASCGISHGVRRRNIPPQPRMRTPVAFSSRSAAFAHCFRVSMLKYSVSGVTAFENPRKTPSFSEASRILQQAATIEIADKAYLEEHQSDIWEIYSKQSRS
jgi:hypothetical protein